MTLPTLNYATDGNQVRAATSTYQDIEAIFTVPPSRMIIPIIRLLPGTPLDYFNANCPMVTDEDGLPHSASFSLSADFTLTLRDSNIGTK